MSDCKCECGHGAVRPGAVPTITAETTIEELKHRPGALDVLQQFGLDHCCGAPLALGVAAAAAGVRVEDVLAALAPVGTRA